jgi:DNA-binding transcriptional regulator YiaG
MASVSEDGSNPTDAAETPPAAPLPTGGDIRRARQELKLTPEDFARMFAVSASTLEAWEEGRTAPDLLQRIYLARLIGNAEPAAGAE